MSRRREKKWINSTRVLAMVQLYVRLHLRRLMEWILQWKIFRFRFKCNTRRHTLLKTRNLNRGTIPSNNVIKVLILGRDPTGQLCGNKIDEVVSLCKLKILTDHASVFSTLSPVSSSRLCCLIIRGLKKVIMTRGI